MKTDISSDCPAGYFRHFMSCYSFHNTTLNWIEAEKHCQTSHVSAHLIGLETADEESFLLQYRNYNKGASAIGLKDTPNLSIA